MFYSLSPTNLKELVRILNDVQEVNMVVGPDSNTGYYHLVEIVFMKTSG